MIDKGIVRISEERAIEELIYALVKNLDEGNWEELRNYFHAEVSLDMSSLTEEPVDTLSPDAIIKKWKKDTANVDAVHHQLSNFRVDIDGEVARAYCYGTTYHYITKNEASKIRMFVGTYDFSAIYNDGKWVINGLTYQSRFVKEIG